MFIHIVPVGAFPTRTTPLRNAPGLVGKLRVGLRGAVQGWNLTGVDQIRLGHVDESPYVPLFVVEQKKESINEL